MYCSVGVNGVSWRVQPLDRLYLDCRCRLTALSKTGSTRNDLAHEVFDRPYLLSVYSWCGSGTNCIILVF